MIGLKAVYSRFFLTIDFLITPIFTQYLRMLDLFEPTVAVYMLLIISFQPAVLKVTDSVPSCHQVD